MIGTLPALSILMRKKTSRREVTDRSATVDIVSQLECAFHHPQATAIGALIGGIVPWFARTLAHSEVPSVWSAGNHGLALIMITVVLGCACFSGLTVYKFGRACFGDARKAIGFTLALEGVMLVSHGITSAVALLVLILINALANGSVIALAREATCRQRASYARGAATRMRNQKHVPVAAPTVVQPAQPAQPAAKPVRPASPGGMIWLPLMFDDTIIDAEIVSEELLS